MFYLIASYLVLCVIVTIILITQKKEEFLDLLSIFSEIVHDDLNYVVKVFFILLFAVLLLCVFIFIIAVSPFMLIYIKRKGAEERKEQELQTQKQEETKGDGVALPHYQFMMKHDECIRPDIGEIFYIETSFNPEINDFFERNYEKVRELFRTKYIRDYNPDLEGKGFTFVYLPRTINELDIDEILQYNRPDLKEKIPVIRQQLAEQIHTQFVEGLYGNHWMIRGGRLEGAISKGKRFQSEEYGAEGIEISQGFIHYKRTEFNERNNTTEDIYTYFPLKYENDEQFFELIIIYIENSGTKEGLYKKRLTPVKIDEMDEGVQELTKEIIEKIDKLRGMGLNNFILNQLLFPQVNLSKMKITADYRIFLVDYNNTEICMPTLSKALFFTYLRHPVGIPFKKLVDYKDEILMLYQKITNRDDLKAIKKSIDSLVDPTGNSINEKCSRIRNAFVQHFDEDVAQYYYITSKESMVCLNKVIALDRSLVIDEGGILK